MGREGGYRLLRRYGRYIRLDERKVKLGQYLFRKHGDKVVFFGRFIAVLRTGSPAHGVRGRALEKTMLLSIHHSLGPIT